MRMPARARVPGPLAYTGRVDTGVAGALAVAGPLGPPSIEGVFSFAGGVLSSPDSTRLAADTGGLSARAGLANPARAAGNTGAGSSLVCNGASFVCGG